MRTTLGLKMYCSRLNRLGSLASSRGLLMMPSFTSLRHVPYGSSSRRICRLGLPGMVVLLWVRCLLQVA
jgi:hypothetical protein